MSKRKQIINHAPSGIKDAVPDIEELVHAFLNKFEPLEKDQLHILVDARTNAQYCECHIQAGKLVELSTIDVPLDPETQSEYRANRDILEDHVAFEKMKKDALARRTFSNIVAEYVDTQDQDQSLQIIGGQHRIEAIKLAYSEGINEAHGIKVYFALDMNQRLDVQLISNTNIAASSDLLDRMFETSSGPELRDWCHEVGLLYEGQDFSDRRQRGQPITVRAARTFILNYLRGAMIDSKAFDASETTPIIPPTGQEIQEWEQLKSDRPDLWKDRMLLKAGQEFAQLALAQREYFSANEKRLRNVDSAEKTFNYAIISSWSYVAGLLARNKTRLQRHYSLKNQTGKDPLNAAVLAKGRHKTDPENYRGLGYRTDAKERGRFVELFFLQAEKGEGITKRVVDLAITKFHAKQAMLEVRALEEKA